GVDMTSDVKGEESFFEVFIMLRPSESFAPGDQESRYRKSRSQEETTVDPAAIRGLVPPDLCPSGACRHLGPRRPEGLGTPSRVAPHRGGVSSETRWYSAAFWRSGVCPDGVTGTSVAMAHRKPISARARATTPWCTFFPRASRGRY